MRRSTLQALSTFLSFAALQLAIYLYVHGFVPASTRAFAVAFCLIIVAIVLHE